MALMGRWEQVPWWHPRRWFGQSMRRWVWDSFNGPYDGQWQYAVYSECAKQILEETYGP